MGWNGWNPPKWTQLFLWLRPHEHGTIAVFWSKNEKLQMLQFPELCLFLYQHKLSWQMKWSYSHAGNPKELRLLAFLFGSKTALGLWPRRSYSTLRVLAGEGKITQENSQLFPCFSTHSSFTTENPASWKPGVLVTLFACALSGRQIQILALPLSSCLTPTVS